MATPDSTPVPPNINDLTGRRFVRLVILARDPDGTVKHPRWFCRCDCGTEKSIGQSDLKRGDVTSCGCRRAEIWAAKNLCRHPEYQIYRNIKYRCCNPSMKEYPDYGGRGISICARWAESFWNFLEDMGSRPSPSHSIDRIDNDGDYEPSNCRWATPKEQARNKRTSHLVEYLGVKRTLAEWSEIYSINSCTLKKRLARGWSPERALTVPSRGPCSSPASMRES